MWGYSLAHAGIAASPGPLLVIPTAVVSGKITARAGHRRLLVGGALLFAAGALWNAAMLASAPSYVVMLPGIVLTGVGTGMVMPSLSAAAVVRLPPARFGVGSAVNQSVRQIGSVFGVARCSRCPSTPARARDPLRRRLSTSWAASTRNSSRSQTPAIVRNRKSCQATRGGMTDIQIPGVGPLTDLSHAEGVHV